jgi:formylglycine-generating enzyme required for sulfatase activity
MDTRVLGDYNIIKQIGQGSLGTVYLAEHRFMKNQYALKVLPEELATDRGFIQRFEEEVRRLATLEHPHIVKIYNVSFAQGVYFLVTDCVVDAIGETTNLAQYIATKDVANKGTKFKEEEALSILTQVADALDYAHGKKGGEGAIVHRGLKLNNVLVGKGNRHGGVEVYLSDFGLSKVVGTGAVLSRTYMVLAEALSLVEGGGQARKPQEGHAAVQNDPNKLSLLHSSFLQNYAFLAPEQKRVNDPRGVDTTADVYAFGVLAYYLLTREFPEGLFEMPSKKAPEYRWNWDALISQCLQPNPANRPTSLLDALDEIYQEQAAASDVEEKSARTVSAPTFTAMQMKLNAAMPSGSPTSTPSVASVMFKRVETPSLSSTSVLQKETSSNLATATMTKPVETRPVETRSAESLPTKELPPGVRVMEKPAMKTTEAAVTTATTPPTSIEEFLARPEPQVTTYQPERKMKAKIEPIMTDMVLIQGGSFWRGSQDGNRDEMPRHQVTLDSFAIDVHPVTNEQFILFLEFMGGEKDHQNHDTIILRESRLRRSAGKLAIEPGYAKHPVVGVSWYGAVAYANWVGKRLPTEAEWEVAARGGIANIPFPTGEQIEKSQANFFSSDTTPVMSYAPNNLGLYDISGNVYEWCQDWYSYNFYETSALEPTNPSGPLQGVYRVLRGGCWKSLQDDLRCSHRHRNNPGTVNSTYGFRCAAIL